MHEHAPGHSYTSFSHDCRTKIYFSCSQTAACDVFHTLLAVVFYRIMGCFWRKLKQIFQQYSNNISSVYYYGDILSTLGFHAYISKTWINCSFVLLNVILLLKTRTEPRFKNYPGWLYVGLSYHKTFLLHYCISAIKCFCHIKDLFLMWTILPTPGKLFS